MIQRVAAVGLVLAAIGTNVTADRVSIPQPPAQLAGEPVAIAVLVEGSALGAGLAPTHEDPEPLFPTVQLAIDTIADLAPSGSMGALVVFDEKVKALREIGPCSTMRGDALGRETDYTSGKRELVDGMTRALTELEPLRTARKALIVFGSGTDTHLDTVDARLRKVVERAQRDGIEVYALVYTPALEGDLAPLRSMPSVHVTPIDRYLDIVPAFEATLRDIVGTAPRSADREPAVASSPAASGSTRTIAWTLLAAGVVLGALGAVALLRRRGAAT